MRRLKLAIRVSDAELAEVLARIIASSYACFELTAPDSEEVEMVINDELVQSSCGVAEMLSKAAEGLKGDFRFGDRAGLCSFTAFTSGCGGSGVSTCARLYGSMRAALDGKKVLLLSLDPYITSEGHEANSGRGIAELITVQMSEGKSISMLPGCISNAHGLYTPRYSCLRNPLFDMSAKELEKIFICLENSGDWDEVVIDVPRASEEWFKVMFMCEKRVFIIPADERADLTRRAIVDLEYDRAPEEENRNYSFQPARYESGEEASDVYGPAGYEVRKLAKAMANG